MKIRQNLHIHSHHSCDSACATIADIQQEMLKLGMIEFGLSDHLHTNYNLCDIQGAKKDRHENFGYGTIGFNTLINIIYNERLSNIPKILESPYVDKDYPPFKFEIEMFKNKKFNENLYNDIVNYYKK